MRHEEKFICSQKQMDLLECRLAAVMQKDKNQKGEGYRIRSLYFDTADERLYHESVSGTDRRRKYRIRFYNMDDGFFRIERKDTVGRLKQKYQTPVDKTAVQALIAQGSLEDGDDDLVHELYVMQQTEGLHPVAVVDYFRTAYTYPVGNVRITLDKDISCTYRTEDLLDAHALLFPVMPQGRHILEIKYDGMLPGFIASVLDIGFLEQVSFSKYVHSMDVIKGNGRKEEGFEY